MKPLTLDVRGFSLIELITVIVIIAALAVIAAPRFLNLQQQARVASLQGAASAFLAANTQVYTKALIQSQTTVDSDVFNIDTDNDGNADVIGYFGHIKNAAPARALAGLDSSLTITKSPGVAFSNAYFLVSLLEIAPADNKKCMIEIFYPSASAADGSISTNLVSDDC